MSVMREHTPPSGGTRRRFAKEFKADAVALILDGDRSIASVARGLGIGETNLGSWVRRARIDRGEKPGLASSERAGLARLRREDARLGMGRELLKRAAAGGVNVAGRGADRVGPVGPVGRASPSAACSQDERREGG